MCLNASITLVRLWKAKYRSVQESMNIHELTHSKRSGRKSKIQRKFNGHLHSHMQPLDNYRLKVHLLKEHDVITAGRLSCDDY